MCLVRKRATDGLSECALPRFCLRSSRFKAILSAVCGDRDRTERAAWLRGTKFLRVGRVSERTDDLLFFFLPSLLLPEKLWMAATQRGRLLCEEDSAVSCQCRLQPTYSCGQPRSATAGCDQETPAASVVAVGRSVGWPPPPPQPPKKEKVARRPSLGRGAGELVRPAAGVVTPNRARSVRLRHRPITFTHTLAYLSLSAWVKYARDFVPNVEISRSRINSGRISHF